VQLRQNLPREVALHDERRIGVRPDVCRKLHKIEDSGQAFAGQPHREERVMQGCPNYFDQLLRVIVLDH
jgi:hypothetical protein